MAQFTNKIEPDQTDILAYYETIRSQLERTHGAIWEEIKHFSWFLSVLIGVPFLLLGSNNGEHFFFAYGWIFFLVGAIVSLVGAKIIHRESHHLLSFAYYVHRVEWVIGLYNDYPALDDLNIPDRSIASQGRSKYFNEQMDQEQFVEINNCFRLSSIRWLFIVLFVIYFLVTLSLFLWIVIYNFF